MTPPEVTDADREKGVAVWHEIERDRRAHPGCVIAAAIAQGPRHHRQARA